MGTQGMASSHGAYSMREQVEGDINPALQSRGLSAEL